MPNRTVAPYSFPRNRAAFAPIRPSVDPEHCEQGPCSDIPLMIRESRMFVLSRSVSVIIVALAKERSRSVAGTDSS
jgi:hypothetical protein